MIMPAQQAKYKNNNDMPVNTQKSMFFYSLCHEFGEREDARPDSVRAVSVRESSLETECIIYKLIDIVKQHDRD